MSRSRGRRRGRQQDRNPRRQQRLEAQASAKKSRAPRSAHRPPPGNVVTLDPLAPVIVRSGRPFDDQQIPDPARFPPPSTVAGCLRTAWARATGKPFGRHLAELSVSGPLLLTRSDRTLVPKPADALYFGHGDSAKCVRAEPGAFDPDCDADLPNGLLPVQLGPEVQGKRGEGPAWWSLDDLLDFRSGTDVTHGRLRKNGWSPGEGDRRTHVAIDRKTGASDAGRLFQTEGLVLDGGLCSSDAGAGGLRLLVRIGESLGAALVHLGGERRLAALEPASEDAWRAPRQGWFDGIARQGGLSLTLLTPAIFSAGYRPGWLDDSLSGSPPAVPGVRLRLRAVAGERWQPHSGWDLAANRPRATRKLARAGSTYWFDILGDADPAALHKLWLANVSDDDQDRRDGFGLLVPGPWTPC